MISDDDKEWSLKCKLGTTTDNIGISELRKGRLVYDTISRSFSAFHYNAKCELKLKVLLYKLFLHLYEFFIL